MSALLGINPITLNVLLVGKTGHGKSATGNTILQRKEFVAKCSTTSVTKWVTFGTNVIGNKEILVADTPGYADTDPDSHGGKKAAIELVVSQIRQALIECRQGYDAILYVTRLDIRYTAEEMETFQTIKKIIGSNNLRRHGILIFTHGDTFDEDEMKMPFGKWCKSQTGNLRNIFNGFGISKVVLMDNKTPDESVKTQQLRRLIVKVDNSRRSLESRRYTMYNFTAVEVGRTHLLVSAKKEDVATRVDAKIAELTQTLNEEPLWPTTKSTSTRSIIRCIDEELERVKREDQETGVLESEVSKLEILKGRAEEVYSKAIEEDRERVLLQQRLQRERAALEAERIRQETLRRKHERELEEIERRRREWERKKTEEQEKQWRDIEAAVEVGAMFVSAIYSLFKSDDSDKERKRTK